MSLAVASGGASVLDRLGLPQGLIATGDSKNLTDVTALRPGDRFYVSSAEGGRGKAVTIDAADTLQTLARKIEQASSGQLKVSVVTDAQKTGPNGEITGGLLQRLSITPRDGREGAVLSAGERGGCTGGSGPGPRACGAEG